MLFLNIKDTVVEDASNLLAQYKLGIKSNFNINDCKYHLLNLIIKQRDELQSKLF